MRAVSILCSVMWAACVFAKDLPVFLSGGLGSADSYAKQSLIFTAGGSLILADIDPGVTRAELCIGGWYLRQKYYFSPGDDAPAAGLRSGYSIKNSQGCYQAAKLSWRTRELPHHSPLFEFGAGLGLHEEWHEGVTLRFVPRIHVSMRFCFFPSRAASSYIELEALPRASSARFEDVGSLFWAKLGYWWHV